MTQVLARANLAFFFPGCCMPPIVFKTSVLSRPSFLNLVGLTVAAVALLCGCGPSRISFPSDAEISSALASNFSQDANNAKARELVQLLGGEKGRLQYKVQQVIYRQGAFEARYEVSLAMGKPGAESLQKLFATMIPNDVAAKLPDQTLASYEKWLSESATSLDKSNPQQAIALRTTVENLGKCYRAVQTGESVSLMDGLSALVSPARDGWYAEKLPSAQLSLQCLPL